MHSVAGKGHLIYPSEEDVGSRPQNDAGPHDNNGRRRSHWLAIGLHLIPISSTTLPSAAMPTHVVNSVVSFGNVIEYNQGSSLVCLLEFLAEGIQPYQAKTWKTQSSFPRARILRKLRSTWNGSHGNLLNPAVRPWPPAEPKVLRTTCNPPLRARASPSSVQLKRYSSLSQGWSTKSPNPLMVLPVPLSPLKCVGLPQNPPSVPAHRFHSASCRHPARATPLVPRYRRFSWS